MDNINETLNELRKIKSMASLNCLSFRNEREKFRSTIGRTIDLIESMSEQITSLTQSVQKGYQPTRMSELESVPPTGGSSMQDD